MSEVSFSPELIGFFRKPNMLVLGTLRQDGSIQMSPVWFDFENNVFLISTTTTRVKFKNMERDPRVTFVIMDKDNPYQYVQIRGKAGFSKDGAVDLINRLSKRYTGNPKYQGDLGDRIVVTVTPLSFMKWGFS